MLSHWSSGDLETVGSTFGEKYIIKKKYLEYTTCLLATQSVEPSRSKKEKNANNNYWKKIVWFCIECLWTTKKFRAVKNKNISLLKRLKNYRRSNFQNLFKAGLRLIFQSYFFQTRGGGIPNFWLLYTFPKKNYTFNLWLEEATKNKYNFKWRKLFLCVCV